MSIGDIESQLETLLSGLADQKIQDGHSFVYDGSKLLATDIGEMMLPCALVLASGLRKYLGMPDAGYDFQLGEPNPLFPIHAKKREKDGQRNFFELAPFVTEVFENAIFECRQDLAQIYVLAVTQMGMRLEDGAEPPQVSLSLPRRVEQADGMALGA